VTIDNCSLKKFCKLSKARSEVNRDFQMLQQATPAESPNPFRMKYRLAHALLMGTALLLGYELSQ
jgi:hypothetical protein